MAVATGATIVRGKAVRTSRDEIAPSKNRSIVAYSPCISSSDTMLRAMNAATGDSCKSRYEYNKHNFRLTNPWPSYLGVKLRVDSSSMNKEVINQLHTIRATDKVAAVIANQTCGGINRFTALT